MVTITIPKKINMANELMAVPKNIYGEFLKWQEAVKSRKIFKPTTRERKAVRRGRLEISRGNYVTLEKLSNELASKDC